MKKRLTVSVNVSESMKQEGSVSGYSCTKLVDGLNLNGATP